MPEPEVALGLHQPRCLELTPLTLILPGGELFSNMLPLHIVSLHDEEKDGVDRRCHFAHIPHPTRLGGGTGGPPPEKMMMVLAVTVVVLVFEREGLNPSRTNAGTRG